MKKLLTIIILLSGCNNHNYRMNNIRLFEKNVSKINYQWGSTDIKKLSKLSNSIDIIYPGSIEAFEYCGVFFFCKMEEKEFLSLYKDTEDISLCQSNVSDSCNLFIENTNNGNISNCNKKYPLPNIFSQYGPIEQSSMKISDQSIFFVLKYKEGIYLDDRFILKKRNLNTRIKNNGYSLGIIFDKSNFYVVYWVIVW